MDEEAQVKKPDAESAEEDQLEHIPQEPALVDLSTGLELDPISGMEITRAALTRVIVLAGSEASGKTTLLVSLYERFQEGAFTEYLFAGSRTLLGLEMRCHRARIQSGASKPDTERTRFLREEGVVHTVLCHHPPQWFWDQDSSEEALNAHARIQLFGHKHSQRLDLVNSNVRLSAGAMHPNRLESGWQPRYNVVIASVSGQGDSRVLDVVAWPRVWNPTQRRFAPDFDPEGFPSRRFPLPVDAWKGPSARRAEPEAAVPVQAQAPGPTSASTTTVHPLEGRALDPARKLVYRFLNLPYHTRVSIANNLGIWRDEEKDLPSVEAFRRCFVRAKQLGVLERLSEEVERQFASDTDSSQSASRATVGESRDA